MTLVLLVLMACGYGSSYVFALKAVAATYQQLQQHHYHYHYQCSLPPWRSLPTKCQTHSVSGCNQPIFWEREFAASLRLGPGVFQEKTGLFFGAGQEPTAVGLPA